MADKFIYISNVDTQNYPYCRLQLVIETLGHSTSWTNQYKIPKVDKQNGHIIHRGPV